MQSGSGSQDRFLIWRILLKPVPGLIIHKQSPIFSSVTKNTILANFMQILIFSIFLRQPVAISATKPPNQTESD